MVVQRSLDLSYMDSDGTARGLSLGLMTTAMEYGVQSLWIERTAE